ncbi:DUF1385 domain-containing protein [Candidatus Woesearchaeota archaeon]|nr:DUF1385 domain-containing protein [Candidatus Woesearchaeota archaeon]
MKPVIGGQAVIEGVMMRSPGYYATAVRLENGKIATEMHKIRKKPRWTQVPFLRGIINMFEMLIIGIKSLTWSADQFEEEPGKKLTGMQLFFTIAISLLFSLALFLVLPYFLTWLLGIDEERQTILFNLVDGLIKIAILVLYLLIISSIKDIYRLFEYHGAEHKVVHCYESGKKLNVDNAKRFTRLHPRCGTSFLFIVLFISIFVFAFTPGIMASLLPSFSSYPLLLRKTLLFAARLMLVPVVAGISYELLRLTAFHEKNKLLKAFAWPGLMLQYITTKEPNAKQIEVAIKAMDMVIRKDKLISK